MLLAPPSLVYLTTVLISVTALYYYIPRFGSRYSLLHIALCSLLGAITVLCSAAIASFIGKFLKGDRYVLLSPGLG